MHNDMGRIPEYGRDCARCQFPKGDGFPEVPPSPCVHHRAEPYNGDDLYRPGAGIQEIVGALYLGWDGRIYRVTGYDPCCGFLVASIPIPTRCHLAIAHELVSAPAAINRNEHLQMAERLCEWSFEKIGAPVRRACISGRAIGTAYTRLPPRNACVLHAALKEFHIPFVWTAEDQARQ